MVVADKNWLSLNFHCLATFLVFFYIISKKVLKSLALFFWGPGVLVVGVEVDRSQPCCFDSEANWLN